MQFLAMGFLPALGSIVGKFLTDSFLKFVAWKIVIVSLITVTLPIILKNLITSIFTTVMDVAGNSVNTEGISSITYEFSGFAGYIAPQLMIPESIAVILTALSIRLILNFIPFIG